LRNAALAGDSGRVERLLECNDIEADLADMDGYTPLLIAAEDCHKSVVKHLLELTLKIKRPNTLRRTAPYLAVYNNHEPVVRQLLSREGVHWGRVHGNFF